MITDLKMFRKLYPFSILRNEEGYLLIVVTVIGLILAIIFGYVLPQLHTGQQIRAMNNLNEYRAYEAAKKGINAVRLGLRGLGNFQDLLSTGYPITGVSTVTNKFFISHDYASLFPAGTLLTIYNSTSNNGVYEVAGDAVFSSVSTETEIEVIEHICSSTVDGRVSIRGILWAIYQQCGATTCSTNLEEYSDEEGNVQFISGCLGIDVSTAKSAHERGMLDLAVVVFKDASISKSLEIYSFQNGGIWTHLSGIDLDTVNYFNFDDSGAYDFKYMRETSGDWYFSIGNNGTYRKQSSLSNELWDLKVNIPVDNRPFEVFVIVRSTGITVAPDTDYATDKTSLRLINEANPHLPNPMRQVLEAGFYLVDEGAGLKEKRFYFGQAHNLKD